MGASDTVAGIFQCLVLIIFALGMYRNTIEMKHETIKHNEHVRKLVICLFSYAGLLFIGLAAMIILQPMRVTPGTVEYDVSRSLVYVVIFLHFLKFLLVPVIFVSATEMRLGEKRPTSSQLQSAESTNIIKRKESPSGRQTPAGDVPTVLISEDKAHIETL
jgi:hypothetical protein